MRRRGRVGGTRTGTKTRRSSTPPRTFASICLSATIRLRSRNALLLGGISLSRTTAENPRTTTAPAANDPPRLARQPSCPRAQDARHKDERTRRTTHPTPRHHAASAEPPTATTTTATGARIRHEHEPEPTHKHERNATQQRAPFLLGSAALCHRPPAGRVGRAMPVRSVSEFSLDMRFIIKRPGGANNRGGGRGCGGCGSRSSPSGPLVCLFCFCCLLFVAVRRVAGRLKGPFSNFQFCAAGCTSVWVGRGSLPLPFVGAVAGPLYVAAVLLFPAARGTALPPRLGGGAWIAWGDIAGPLLVGSVSDCVLFER